MEISLILTTVVLLFLLRVCSRDLMDYSRTNLSKIELLVVDKTLFAYPKIKIENQHSSYVCYVLYFLALLK